MTPDSPVSAEYVAGMVVFYCARLNHVAPRAGIHLNSHGSVSVGYWAWMTRVLAEANLWRPATYPIAITEADHERRLLRDIFGNPFRPVAADPTWLTSPALSLAGWMYETRDFSPMPILANALHEAGCDSAAVLDHCRGPGPHVRGCRVADLLLGKT